jgi:hypothetical protein
VRRWLIITSALVALAAAGGVATLYWTEGDSGDTPRAVIIDQLASTDANPEFVASATARLESAGYTVDYIDGEAVSVDLFRELPKRGYDVIVVRNHAGQLERRPVKAVVNDGNRRAVVGGGLTQPVSTFFTNEAYRTDRHVAEQRDRLLGVAYYPPPSEDGGQYFGVTPEFIASTGGDFGGALVVLMGCGGEGSAAMAQAFLDKGARSVVTWNDLVSAQHTDNATTRLLDNVLVSHRSIGDAVADTMASVGPDPAFQARLHLYEDD